MRRLLWILSVVAACFVATPARATPDFPGLIVSDLNIKCDGGASPIWDGLGCTLCHTSNTGGIGTVQHPFGAALKSEGLTAFNEQKLQQLLTAEKTAQHDFNCDGIPDIQELESCDWPALVTLGTACDAGASGDGGALPDSIMYGCTTTTSPSQASPVPALIAALAIGMLLVTRVARRSRRRPCRSTRR